MTSTDNPWIPLFITTESFIQPEQLPESAAEHFLEKAKKAIDSAKKEVTYGQKISDLIFENGQTECQKSLATIGVWHYECGIELLHKAVRNFEKAKERELTRDVQKEVEAQIKECKKQLPLVIKQKDMINEFLKS